MPLDGINPSIPRRPIAHDIILPRKKRSRRWKWITALVLLFVVGFSAYHFIWAKTNKIFTNDGNIFSRVGRLIIGSDKLLQGEETGMVNILLMGIGGAGHNGAHLTDTMIVASLNTKTSEVVLTSIPRDFAYTIPDRGFNKINAAYAYAYMDNERTAGDAAILAAETVTGLDIPYFAVIDFTGFVSAVDNVGGLDVVVENTFTDATFPNDYPKDTKGYLSPVTFTKGPAHMDGRTALIFARSRHSGDANEGSDFARSERQKKILTAFKDKVLALNLGNLSTINNLLSDFTENFRTNLEPYEMKRLLDLSEKVTGDTSFSFSLEPDGILLCSALVDARTGKIPPKVEATPEENKETSAPNAEEPNQENADTEPAVDTTPQITLSYVVMPCAGKTLADLHSYIAQAPFVAKLKKEGAILEAQNSVGVTGLATKTFGSLADLGITLNYTTFKGKVPYEETVLYDNSHGGKPDTLEYLKSHFKFIVSDVNYPSSSADFVIILGKDAVK